jgi:type I restriction enzyme S subunit
VSAELAAQEPSAKYLVNLQPPLLRHFDLIAQAPGGVARLRELILALAVQGKLVPQDPSDEPASELLKKIRAEKDRLIAEGKIKREKPLAKITGDEKPFELPTSWSWCKGREIFNVIRGVTYQKTDARETPAADHLPLLRANNIQAAINLDDLVYVPKKLVSDDQCLRRGDYLVCLASGSKKLVGKAAPFTEEIDCSFGAFCGAIRPVTDMDFLAIYLSSPLYRETVSVASAGIGINNLKGASLLALDIPLPPLAEQSRIVIRVEELMQLCDALEAQGQLEAEQHARLVSTLFDSLLQSDIPEALADNWQRIATHFDLLLDRPEAVDALEQTILQLAVRGLLVPQDPTDEPASVLLQKIRTEKDHLIAQGKIKRDKPPPPITDEEKPFELPQGWQLTRLGALMELISGQHLGPNEYVEGLDGGIPYLTGPAEFGTESPSPTRSTKETRAVASSGDILITVKGSGVGKLNVVRHPEIAISRQLMAIRPLGVNFDFVLLVLKTMAIKFQAQAVGIAIPGIGRDDVSGSSVALPPMAEQSRIVTRVNELRALCAELRLRLTASQLTQSHLADALVVQ